MSSVAASLPSASRISIKFTSAPSLCRWQTVPIKCRVSVSFSNREHDFGTSALGSLRLPTVECPEFAIWARQTELTNRIRLKIVCRCASIDDVTNRRGDERVSRQKERRNPTGNWTWGLLSLTCGMLVSLALYIILPVVGWNIALGCGLLLAVVIMMLNPAWTYKRILVALASAGMLNNVLDGTLSISFGDANVFWRRGVNVASIVAWVIVIAIFVWADRRHPPR